MGTAQSTTTGSSNNLNANPNRNNFNRFLQLHADMHSNIARHLERSSRLALDQSSHSLYSTFSSDRMLLVPIVREQRRHEMFYVDLAIRIIEMKTGQRLPYDVYAALKEDVPWGRWKAEATGREQAQGEEEVNLESPKEESSGSISTGNDEETKTLGWGPDVGDIVKRSMTLSAPCL